jgi:hypothetical protein
MLLTVIATVMVFTGYHNFSVIKPGETIQTVRLTVKKKSRDPKIAPSKHFK